ncbi:MAG: LLM class flavin-dependent oxidoreductase [Candidatus Dactylopiibacterium sp.]|nr:LLM class flavin-dependent oxidoreductase [Candidatus Dactylopiibacterium sp.]
MPVLSVLDLAPIALGSHAAESFRHSVELARSAESWGYRRYWLAEHHGMPGIASAATVVLIGHIADATRTLRVGAGGIMLPNHSPLVVAEQFGTLATLYPGRIDLGLGRAPGSDTAVARALRRSFDAGDVFPQDVAELLGYFAPAAAGQAVRAVPGEGCEVPVWILGSSLFGAQLAAAMGLPFAFASHFAPGFMQSAITLYRERFRPSARLAQPYVMLGYNVYAADSHDEAQLIATSMQQAFVQLRSGRPGLLPPPVREFARSLPADQRAQLDASRECSAIGTLDEVREAMQAFVARTGADELMISCATFDPAARLRSYAIAAQAAGLPGAPRPAACAPVTG